MRKSAAAVLSKIVSLIVLSLVIGQTTSNGATLGGEGVSQAVGSCSSIQEENGAFKLYLSCVRIMDSAGVPSEQCWDLVMVLDTDSLEATIEEVGDPYVTGATGQDPVVDLEHQLFSVPLLEFRGQLFSCDLIINSDLSLVLDLFSIESLGSAAGVCAETPSGQSQLDVTQLTETDQDILGIYLGDTAAYTEAMAAGARIVNLGPMNTFFVVWVPEGYEEMTTRRVMVVAHGHTGSSYYQTDLELPFAREYGYAIVAIQWWTGQGDQMYSGEQFYQFMDIALKYMAYRYNAQLDKCAYRGWSMGSEISFEVTYLDRINGTNYLKLTISHDGGMNPDASQLSVGREFVTNLYAGVYGDDVFLDRHFYLYAGQEGQAAYMRNTAEVITRNGGVVEALIEDIGAGHAGFFLHPQYHEEALRIFFQLAP